MRIRRLTIAAGLAAVLTAGLQTPVWAVQDSGTTAAATCTIRWQTSGGHSGFTAGYSWAWNTIVQRGDEGNAVREIQCLVNSHAYYDGPKLTVDGAYGQLTESAVRRLQTNWSRAHSITIDGIVGPQTWRALRSA
ncbi:peptidoglycan-binding domain-containing protein [Streptomyces sediminimaris]|uniref:peptidoglycan-binding domain-containing protein n=1 Tax=Streptomyces sediminimaris TaxID=3383721 RepID=UPI00399AB582